MGAVRDRLRAATHDVHEALHRAGAFARIADGSIDGAGYGALLRTLHRYHRGMEQACIAGAAALGAPELGVAQHNRVLRLEADLAALSLAPMSEADACAAKSGFAVGCLYTVLGSTLGGKVIYRQLEFLFTDGNGRSFFRGTEEDGENWKKFCTLLEDFGQRRSTAAIEAGAIDAFGQFGDMLQPAALSTAS